MRTLEFSGRTVDEAIFHGLQEMGVTIDQVDIVTVQSESKGIFGFGVKPAIVRLIEREVPVVPDFDAVNEERKKSREDRPREERRERGGKDRRDRKPRSDRPRQEADEEAVAPAKEDFPYSLETAENCESAKFLQELLNKMQINATVKAFVEDDNIRLNIESDTDGLLIGRRGETLDALQYLVNLYENRDRKDESYTRVSVDTEGYRARREETLCKLARRTALRVYKTGRKQAMEPMNPYERRILHSALHDFRGVTTHSEGEEPNRRVVIEPDR